MSNENKKIPLIVVAGPTAAGKSECAVELARRIDGEIISADSMQVYRYMDIGSAKITLEEMMGIPHYMIDVADPSESFDVARYKEMAKACVEEIHSRGHIPILCGGTGFYIQAVTRDIDFTDTFADPDYRNELLSYAGENGADALHRRLAEVDPCAAEQIHPNNLKRVIRALEFFRETGRKISDHNEAERQRETPYDLLFFVISEERAALYDRIDRRVDFMMEEGLLDEVAYLRAMGLTRDMVSMQGLGYKEMLDVLDEKIPYDEGVRILKRDTRHFAKRQLTWFRRERDARWIDRADFGGDSIKIAEFMAETAQRELNTVIHLPSEITPIPHQNQNTDYASCGIDRDVLSFGEKICSGLKDRFDEIDKTAEFNQLKVIHAMQSCRVSEACLGTSTGYGYNDLGRDTLEEVYAKVFHTEAALVRPLISCGTHALSIALAGNLRPGDKMLSIAGKPYDTLEEVIGIRKSKGSLAEFGISYGQVDLLPDGSFDLPGIREAVADEKIRLATIQRSKGYASRRTLSVSQIGEAIACVKSVRPDVICMVDNCYGEFVETVEPSDVGADLVVGSLIKNPGGGLAPVGGYITGKKEYVENASFRMTCPGLGAEVGPSLGVNPSFYQGFFMAPVVTASALKGAVFAAALYETLGYPVLPDSRESRHDIIQAITLGTPEAVIAFCRGIQKAAPVDSHVTPEPWDMPGYDDPVIMAAGAFVGGSSIELSADGPIRPPYNVYFQGGLTWPSAKLGILMSLQCMKEAGLVRLPAHEE